MKIDAKVDTIYRDFLTVTYEGNDKIGLLTLEIDMNEVTKNWKVGDLVSVEIKVVG